MVYHSKHMDSKYMQLYETAFLAGAKCATLTLVQLSGTSPFAFSFLFKYEKCKMVLFTLLTASVWLRYFFNRTLQAMLSWHTHLNNEKIHSSYMLNYLYLLHQYFVEGKIGQQCICTTNGKKKNQYNWDCSLKTQSLFKKRRTTVGFSGKKRIIWAAVGRSAAIFLADIDLFIGLTTNFVFVGSRYNIFCVGGRQSLNNPSNVPQSSSVLRQTVCYVCRWSVDIQKKFQILIMCRPTIDMSAFRDLEFS